MMSGQAMYIGGGALIGLLLGVVLAWSGFQGDAFTKKVSDYSAANKVDSIAAEAAVKWNMLWMWGVFGLALGAAAGYAVDRFKLSSQAAGYRLGHRAGSSSSGSSYAGSGASGLWRG